MARLGRSQNFRPIRLKADIIDTATTITAVGSSAGVATAQATGASTSEQVAASAGVATAQATGASTSAQVGSSSGTVLTSDFISSLINSQVGSSSGSVTVSDFINGTATLVTAVGSSDGVATVLGIGTTTGGSLPTGHGKRRKLPYGWWEDREPEEIERAIERAEDAVEVAAEAIQAPRQERRDAQSELKAALAQIDLDAGIERLASLQAKQARAKLETIAREVALQRKEFERMRAEFEDEKKRRAILARLRDEDDALAVLLS